ncbi:hypothetical protein C8A03DRAFT_45548 [Achaetomium macrosporum]|uniref:Choline dehydrogenase n=1 Tax=Achaetomium macrosporum TaxID=79813 RepID=A0AAN7H9H7_9PEZI|nr:hypothetical protein C8A03DRAFT_45548 [Achaetomium macrosporum]
MQDCNKTTRVVGGKCPPARSALHFAAPTCSRQGTTHGPGRVDQGQDGILVPGAYAPYLYFWPNLVTVRQPGLNNRTPGAITAQVVGGGSTINAMVWLKGDKQDYDAWGSLGNSGWIWQDMLPYLLKDFTAPDAAFTATANISGDDWIRGHSGPLRNSYPNYFCPGSANWWNAANEVGLPPGVFWIPSALDASTISRNYAKLNHYDRVNDSRPNYHLLTSNVVCKVLFRGKTAVWVSYPSTTGGDPACTSEVYAAKEVVLAAGGFGTPKILQLSGVGPKRLLQKLGIRLVEDLPGVGQNLQDQPTLAVPYNSTNATYNAEQRALSDTVRQGAYTTVNSLSTQIGVVSLQAAASSYQDIIAASKAADPADSLPVDVDATVLAGYKAQREAIVNQFASNVRVGTVHWGTPLIDFRTATDPIDLRAYSAVFRKNCDLFAAPSMQALGPTEAAPFGVHLTADEQIAAVMRDQINPTNAHQCSTAAMMPRQLGGVKGLRVADISFWPFQLSGPPQATMYASAERLADLIEKEYCLAGAC